MWEETSWKNFTVSTFSNAVNLANTMKFWIIAALFAGIAVSGAKIANNTTVVQPTKEGETVICNQYIGQGATTNEAIKKLDEKLSKKLDQLIKLLQPSPNPGKNLKTIYFFDLIIFKLSFFSVYSEMKLF